MNLYFVLEGEKTEVQLYPKWIEYVLPELSQVDFEKDVVNNHYYIFSGGGIPSIYITIQSMRLKTSMTTLFLTN